MNFIVDVVLALFVYSCIIVGSWHIGCWLRDKVDDFWEGFKQYWRN